MYFPGDDAKTVDASFVGVPSPAFFETRSRAKFVADALPSAALHTRAMEAEPQPAEGEAVPCPRLHGIRDMRMGTSVFRAPAPGEVLLRIGAVGLCGSDVHYFTHWDKMDGGLATLSERGQIIGHEFSGTVAALGEGVAEAWPELTVGTRVAVRSIQCISAMVCGNLRTVTT